MTQGKASRNAHTHAYRSSCWACCHTPQLSMPLWSCATGWTLKFYRISFSSRLFLHMITGCIIPLWATIWTECESMKNSAKKSLARTLMHACTCDMTTSRRLASTNENKQFHTCIPIDDSFLLGIFSTFGSSLVSVPLSLFKVAFFCGNSGGSREGVMRLPLVTLGGLVLSKLSEELLSPDWLLTSLLWSWLSR